MESQGDYRHDGGRHYRAHCPRRWECGPYVTAMAETAANEGKGRRDLCRCWTLKGAARSFLDETSSDLNFVEACSAKLGARCSFCRNGNQLYWILLCNDENDWLIKTLFLTSCHLTVWSTSMKRVHMFYWWGTYSGMFQLLVREFPITVLWERFAVRKFRVLLLILHLTVWPF